VPVFYFMMNIALLENISFIPQIKYYQLTTSTNEKAKESLPVEDFTTFIAESQTRGKGRNSREWFSPAGENLYFSFVLKMVGSAAEYSGYPLIVAYSILQTIRKIIDKKIFIKWPNDIYVEERKIAGILIEIVKNHLITGIGLNVNSEKFPQFEHNKPTSLFLEKGELFEREKILKEFFINMKANIDIFYKGFIIDKSLLYDINNNLKYKNEPVEILFKNSSKKGIIREVNEKGYLILNDGSVVYAGDVLKINYKDL